MLATVSLDGVIRIYEAPDVMNITHWSIQHEINCLKACSSISWNQSLFRQQSPMIAVGSDDSSDTTSKILFYELHDPTKTWLMIKDKYWEGITELVHDIAFAPNVGRSYDLVGVATTKNVKIVQIKKIQGASGEVSPPLPIPAVDGSAVSHYNISVLASFEDHASQVWRVSWNITGTILASSGDDGAVRLWKCKC